MVAGVTKRDIIAGSIGGIMFRYPGMSAKAAKTLAEGAWKIGGWQGVVALYAVGTNPQRPIDIPGTPVNVGWTPREQQILDFAMDQARKVQAQPNFPTVESIAPGMPITMKLTEKRRKNQFSTAVGKGVRALKASSSYGKKGILNNAKAAFKVATRAASARRQGKKMPKAGPTRIAYKAAKGVYTDEILRRLMK
jgi:hypothetical protein